MFGVESRYAQGLSALARHRMWGICPHGSCDLDPQSSHQRPRVLRGAATCSHGLPQVRCCFSYLQGVPQLGLQLRRPRRYRRLHLDIAQWHKASMALMLTVLMAKLTGPPRKTAPSAASSPSTSPRTSLDCPSHAMRSGNCEPCGILAW